VSDLQPSDPLPSDVRRADLRRSEADASGPDPESRSQPHEHQPDPHQAESRSTDRTGGGALASPDPEPVDTPSLTGGSVEPGETPPSSSQTSGVSHQEVPPAPGISWGFVIAIVLVVVIIGGGAIAAAISYL
jgi:hypothetical protein